jgi:hypothetical protein
MPHYQQFVFALAVERSLSYWHRIWAVLTETSHRSFRSRLLQKYSRKNSSDPYFSRRIAAAQKSKLLVLILLLGQ